MVGTSKSGTTFLYFTLKKKVASINSHLIHEHHVEQKGNGNILSKQLIGEFLEKEGPTVGKLKNNKELSEILSEITSTFSKRIFLVRDPRDNLISRFFWYHSYKNFKGLENDFNSSLSLIKQKEKEPSSVSFKHLIDNLKFCDNHFYTKVFEQHHYIYNIAIPHIISTNMWFVLSYEDMIDRKLDDLKEYLGLQFEIESNLNLDNLKHVARTKSHNNWRSFFTEEDVNWLRPIYNDSLESLGYDPSDWKLNNVDKLDPQFGSEYVKGLYKRK